MAATSSWTQADSLNAMKGSQQPSSCQGGDRAIVATACRSVRLFPRPLRRPRPTLGTTLVLALVRRALRTRTTHRYLVVPRRRHHHRLPTRLQRSLGGRTARRGFGPSNALPRPQAAHARPRRQPSALRHRRHADRSLRPQGAGQRRSPQPDARASRRKIRLRPHLGYAGLAGRSSRLEHTGLAVTRPSLRS